MIDGISVKGDGDAILTCNGSGSHSAFEIAGGEVSGLVFEGEWQSCRLLHGVQHRLPQILWNRLVGNGRAAALCVRLGVSPRDLAVSRFGDLRALLENPDVASKHPVMFRTKRKFWK